jgi:hypothetical protein
VPGPAEIHTADTIIGAILEAAFDDAEAAVMWRAADDLALMLLAG